MGQRVHGPHTLRHIPLSHHCSDSNAIWSLFHLMEVLENFLLHRLTRKLLKAWISIIVQCVPTRLSEGALAAPTRAARGLKLILTRHVSCYMKQINRSEPCILERIQPNWNWRNVFFFSTNSNDCSAVCSFVLIRPIIVPLYEINWITHAFQLRDKWINQKNWQRAPRLSPLV